MNFTKSQCPYCGVGCGLKMKPKSSVSDDKWLVSGIGIVLQLMVNCA